MDYLQHDGESRSKYAGGFTKDGKNTPAYNSDYYKKNREKILAQRRARAQAMARTSKAKGTEKPASREQYKRNNRTASQQQIAGAMNANSHRNDYLNKNENRPKRKTSVSGEKPKQNQTASPKPGGNIDYSQFQKPGQNVHMNSPHPTNSHLAGRRRNDQGQHVTVGKRGEGLIASQNKEETKKKPTVISKEAREARRQTDADRTGEGNWEKNQVQAFKNSRKTGTKPQNAATRSAPITTMSDDERSDVDKAKDFVNGLLQKAGKAAKDVGQKAKKAVDDAWKLRSDIIKDPVGTYNRERDKRHHFDTTSTAVEADVVTGRNRDGELAKNGKTRKYRDRSELARDIAHDKVSISDSALLNEVRDNNDYWSHPDHQNVNGSHSSLYLKRHRDNQDARTDKARAEAKEWQARANAMNTPIARDDDQSGRKPIPKPNRSAPVTRSAMSNGDATGGRRPQGRQRTDNGQHATVGKRGNGVNADRIAKAQAAAAEANISQRHHSGPKLEEARKRAEAIAATVPGAKVVKVPGGTKNKKKSWYYTIEYPTTSSSGPSGNINY